MRKERKRGGSEGKDTNSLGGEKGGARMEIRKEVRQMVRAIREREEGLGKRKGTGGGHFFSP